MAISQYLAEYFALQEFVALCHHGLQHGVEARSYVELSERIARTLRTPAPFPTSKDREEAVRRAAKLEAFAQSQEAQGFPYLYGLAAIKMWALLEAAVDDLVADQLRACPPSTFPAVARIKGSLLEFINASEEERTDIIVEKLKESTDASLKKGCGRFEALLAAVSLGGAVPDGVRKLLYELSEVRNALVHRNATADRRFREACPWFGATPGGSLRLVSDHYLKYRLAVSWYFTELDRRVSVQRGEVIDKDQFVLQEELLLKVDASLAVQVREGSA